MSPGFRLHPDREMPETVASRLLEQLSSILVRVLPPAQVQSAGAGTRDCRGSGKREDRSGSAPLKRSVARSKSILPPSRMALAFLLSISLFLCSSRRLMHRKALAGPDRLALTLTILPYSYWESKSGNTCQALQPRGPSFKRTCACPESGLSGGPWCHRHLTYASTSLESGLSGLPGRRTQAQGESSAVQCVPRE